REVRPTNLLRYAGCVICGRAIRGLGCTDGNQVRKGSGVENARLQDRRQVRIVREDASLPDVGRQQRDALAALIRRVLGPDALREYFRGVGEVDAEACGTRAA